MANISYPIRCAICLSVDVIDTPIAKLRKKITSVFDNMFNLPRQWKISSAENGGNCSFCPQQSHFLVAGSLLYLAETVCRLLPVASFKTLSFHNKNSSTRAYTSNWGGSHSLRKSFLGRSFEEDEFSVHITSDSKSSRRERLIALFQRIQIEISEEESGSGNYSKSTQAIDDDSSVETSVLEFLQQSTRETKVEISEMKHSEDSNRKEQTSEEKSISVPEPPPTKFTRPPSNFVKKSPIPLTTALQSNKIQLTNKEESSSESDGESLKVEGMKLSELKELAKERGIRGYSKLKKSDLVELLKSLL